MNYNPFTPDVAAFIERSTDIPRLEEIYADCARAVRHLRRKIKFIPGHDTPENVEKINAYNAKMQAAEARLIELGM